VKPEEALALVRERRIVPFADFVSAVAGGPVKGSWWGHPKGHEIFNLAGFVRRECIYVKLVEGKETFLHESLYSAFARVVTDDGWRRKRIGALSKEARALLRSVEKAGTLRMDELAKKRGVKVSALSKLRNELEKALLAHGDQEHTDKGNHVTVLVSWAKWVTPAVARDAKKLSLEEALAAVAIEA
jgi:hypothetical protein